MHGDPSPTPPRAWLAEPEVYLRQHEDKLVVLDEIQRTPQLFRSFRELIDAGRRHGHGRGRFLLLGSASIDLLEQSSESVAGRIRYLELAPLDAGEVGRERRDALWLRGGFPESLLAESDAASLRWRRLSPVMYAYKMWRPRPHLRELYWHR